jgi:DNA (cytosine-5)-methyltransferase 1
VFVVGCLGDGAAAAAVLFERESVQRDSSPRRAKGEGAPADASDGAGAGQCKPIACNGEQVTGTICHDDWKGHSCNQSVNDGKLILQPDIVGAIDCRISAQRAQNAAAGHLIAVAVPFRKSKRAQSTTDDESWVEAEQANTLNAFDTGERDTHAVAFSPGNLKRGAGAGPNEEVFPTLKCSAGRGADDQRPCVAIGTDMYNHAITGDVAATMGTPGSSVNASGLEDQHAIGFNWQNAGGYGNANEGLGITVEGTGPLQRCQTPAVAHALRGEGFDASEDGTGRVTPIIPVAHAIGFIPKAPPNSRSMGEEVENGPTVTTHMMGQGVSLSLPMTVRRLTPRECERLQAFPDDYTLIPWRKKPADQCPDGPRYKALGNSMAVNCMEWIGERIAAYEAKERKP